MKTMFIFERSYIKTLKNHKLTKKSLTLTHTDIGYFISTLQKIAGCLWAYDHPGNLH